MANTLVSNWMACVLEASNVSRVLNNKISTAIHHAMAVDETFADIVENRIGDFLAFDSVNGVDMTKVTNLTAAEKLAWVLHVAIFKTFEPTPAQHRMVYNIIAEVAR